MNYWKQFAGKQSNLIMITRAGQSYWILKKCTIRENIFGSLAEWLTLSIYKQEGNSNDEHFFTSKDGSDTTLNAVHEYYRLTSSEWLHGLYVINTLMSQFQKSKYLENWLS